MTTDIAQGPVDVTVGRRVLDPCCGSRMMWFDRQHPDAVFGDKRTEQHVLCDGRTLPKGTKLFTHPANIAEIEQRVAESIAKMCDDSSLDRMYSHDCAGAIRSGKWREYL